MSFVKTFKKIVKIVVFAIIVCLVAAYFTVSFLNRKNNRPTFIFGNAILWVETGSMEPAIEAKSYIAVKKYDGKELGVGDVIVFVCKSADPRINGQLITHRIDRIENGGYITKGDAAAVIDEWVVSKDDIVAVYNRSLGFFTLFGRIFSSYAGLILIFVVFFGSCALIYFPDMINALRDEDKMKQDKEREIEKRVEEEVKKLQEKDREEK